MVHLWSSNCFRVL